MTPRIPFARTEIVPAAQQAALDVLRSGWITTGPQTASFERELAGHLGVRHAVAVSSGTAALELSLRALRLPAGAAVLTPALTFCGAVQAILHAGLRPVLVDVGPEALQPDPAAVTAATRRVGAVAAMVVQHMAGFPAPVADLAAAAGLPLARVVEDAAHGLGAGRAGVPVGRSVGASCLSFYATKNLPIGEGGAVCTDDGELAADVRASRLHGMSRDAWRRYLPGGSWRYDVDRAGMKANFTDVQAAIGRAQLAELPRWQGRRAELADRYDAGLAGVPGLTRPVRPVDGWPAWHLYQVRVGTAYGRTRDALIDALAERGIGTSVHFIPVHRLSYFRRVLSPLERGDLPVTDAACTQLLSLPMHPALSDAEVDQVCQAVAELAAVRRRPARTPVQEGDRDVHPVPASVPAPS